jgi:hypothetical protein
MSTAAPTPPARRPGPPPPARADGSRRDSIWRALLFLIALVLILITVWHAVDRITTRHAEESFATGQIQLRIARLENRARVAEARARVDSAIATAGLGSIHALRGSASPQVQQILEAISNAIARAESSRS